MYKKNIVKNGIIHPDSKFGKTIGFNKSTFSGWLWKDEKYMWISLITSKYRGKGNLRILFDKIEELGYIIIVPTPSNRMIEICLKRGMVPRRTNYNGETVEIMVKV